MTNPLGFTDCRCTKAVKAEAKSEYCVVMHSLNMSIIREQHFIPTVDDVIQTLKAVKCSVRLI